MPSQVRITNFPNFLVESFTSTLHPKVLSLDTSGMDLFHTYCGATWSFAAPGTMLYTITAIRTASAQKRKGKPLAMRRHRAILTIVWRARSATPLYSGVYAAEVVCFISNPVNHFCIPLPKIPPHYLSALISLYVCL
jgi:hypothetical protein